MSAREWSPAAAVQPVSASERAPLIDVLRGFALLGVLMANFGGGVGSWNPAVDERVNALMNLLVRASFYPLFSFLFGLGFAVQLARARARGAGAVHLYFRRMIALFLIGTIHAVFIWSGDILVGYAFLGLLLIPVHRLPPRGMLVLVSVCFLWSLEAPRIDAALEGAAPSNPEASATLELAQGWLGTTNLVLSSRQARAATEGAPQLRSLAFKAENYFAQVRANSFRYAANVAAELSLLDLRWWARLGAGLMTLAMVCGMYVGRMGWLERRSPHRLAFACVACAGVLMATASWFYGRLGLSWGPEGDPLDSIFENAGTTMAYVGALALLMTTRRGAAWLTRLFAPAGRMALTNYLMQSVVATLFLFPYGFGLNSPNPGSTLKLSGLVAFFFLIQIPVSNAWLARFRYGPAEWLWRSLTYGALQPMRRGEVSHAARAPDVGASDLGAVALPPLAGTP